MFKFRQCDDYSEQSKPYLEPLTFARLPGKDDYFNVSIFTLFVFIFNEYFYFFWLRFHYNSIIDNKLNSKKRISLMILETRLSVFAQLLLN